MKPILTRLAGIEAGYEKFFIERASQNESTINRPSIIETEKYYHTAILSLMQEMKGRD